MKNGRFYLYATALLALAAPDAAMAYVGPGLGVGAITAFFGAIFAVLAAILGVIWYPIKRLFRRKKAPGEPASSPDDKP